MANDSYEMKRCADFAVRLEKAGISGDVLGRYRNWRDTNKLLSEREDGWALDEFFNEEDFQRYVKEMTEEE